MKKFPYIVFLVFALVPVSKAEQSSSTRLPSTLQFTQNTGQWADSFLYVADLAAGKLILQKQSLNFLMWEGSNNESYHHGSGNIKAHLFRVTFEGSNPDHEVTPSEKEILYRNYFLGNDKTKWRARVPVYKKLGCKNLWQGVDANFYGNGDALKYDFVVHPSASVSCIQLKYEGVDALKLYEGELHYKTTIGTFRELEPYCYQLINGEQKQVKCRYVLNRQIQTVSFQFPDGYDTTLDLVIDPTLVFSTYTGATADNWGYTATYDEQESMYVGGYVNATNPGTFYPTTVGAFQLNWGGGTGGNTGTGNGIAFSCDMGISKFSKDGSQLLYSTYLGGSDNETPHSLIVDHNDNLVVYGVTYSSDYPVVSGCYDTAWNALGDIVVTKFDAAGSVLLASTFVGGSGDDGINYDPQEFTSGNLKWNYGDQNRGEVVIDAQNNIYVASCTKSADMPVTAGAPQGTFGGAQDGFVFKLDAACQTLLYATYAGGSSDDACYSLDLASDNSVYVAGGTMSADFPSTASTIHTGYQGGLFDGFLFHLNSAGTQFLQSSYIGTAGDDQLYFVKLDKDGDVYFVGQTTGAYPVSAGVYSNPNSGQFIGKVHPDISAHIYSTVFGSGNGQPNISPTAFLVDTCENVYVAGWGTNSTAFTGFYNNMFNMPLSGDAMQTNTDGTDFYFFVTSKNAQSLLYGSYFGGAGIEHVDGGTSRLDKRGVIYQAICAGCGGNSLTPTQPGVWSPTNQSTNCNELGLKIAFNLAGARVEIDAYPRATGCVPLDVQFQSTLSNVQTFIWYFGDGDSAVNQTAPLHTYTDTGIYIAVLIGIDSNSCNIADTAYLQVEVRDDSLVADFTPNLQVDCDSNKVELHSQSYATTSTSWYMGDGNVLAGDSVKHYYNIPGTYDVMLVLNDTTKCNLTDTFHQQIFIPATINASFSLSDSNGCAPFTANFNVTPTGNSKYYWSFGDGTIDTLTAVSHTYFNEGVFQVRLVVVDSNSCNIADTAIATVTVIDSMADADFNFTRTFFGCDSVQVNVWSNYTGEDAELWDFGDGFTSVNDSGFHVYNTAGSFTITHYITDATMVCKPLDTSQIVISLLPLNAAVLINDTGGCYPFTASFVGNTGLLTSNYFWNFGDGFSGVGDTVLHTYNNTGTFNVTLAAVDTNACVGADSAFAQITVINDSVYADFALTILKDCDSNLVVDLTNLSTNALENLWTFGDGTFSTQVNENHSYNLPATYTISLVVSDTNRCHPYDTLSKTVTLKPNVYVDFTLADVCLGTPVQFNNLSNPAAQFSWSFGDGNSSPQFSPGYEYTVSGTYSVQLIITDTSTCDVRDTVVHDVIVNEQPVADFTLTSDTFRYQNEVAFFSHSSNYQHLIWNFGDGSGTTDEITPIHVYESLGWKTVCLEATNLVCNDTICKRIFISFTGLIGVPNAFSPNADGINDIVKIEGKGVIELTFRIYNRWGELVFETHNPQEGWNGIYKGALQEMDVFTYTADVVLIDGSKRFLKGNITLLR